LRGGAGLVRISSTDRGVTRRRAWTPIGVVTVRFIAELRGPSPALIHPTSTLASSAEIDERYVQKQRGHASAKMTRRYQRRHERFRDSGIPVTGFLDCTLRLRHAN
jgi:integrase